MSEDNIINVIKVELATMLLNTVYMWLVGKEQVYMIHTYPFRTWPNKVSQLS